MTMRIALLTLSCLQLGWSEIILTLQDAQKAPIPGVSCSQNGGAPVVSDQMGKLILTNSTSLFSPMRRSAENHSQSRNFQVLREKGIFLVNNGGRNFSTLGRFVNMGEEMGFAGIPFRSNTWKPAAKSTAVGAADASITCSKTGYSTQVYRVAEGSSLTIDFSKLTLVPLYDHTSILEPETVEETPTAIITRFADRARDRHAREDQFKLYDHYLSHYWEHRTAQIEIVDEVAKGGKKIKFNVVTQWKLEAPEFRAFYRGINTVAEYHSNLSMDRDPDDVLKYHTEIDYNPKEGREIRIGDRVEIEVSQFLDKVPEGRSNYYGTAVLYIVGQGGLVPWEAHGVFGDGATEREDSYPIPVEGWLGGCVTLPYQYTDEPTDHFLQMAPNIAPQNGQVFVSGRRVHHTSFVTGEHDEKDNPVWTEMVGKAGNNFVNVSCVSCHAKNGRGLPPATGSVLSNYVVKVGDADGYQHPQLGYVLQPQSTGGTAEGTVTLSGWTESNGLRSPTYSFGGGPVPTHYSARITPQLIGMGLLEAIPEGAIQALEDKDDANGDGISGRMHIVADLATGVPRLGRFGWKAGKASVAHQVAGAFNTDMGVMTSLLPKPDCGSAQTDCGSAGSEISDTNFRNLVDYISLLAVSARRGLKDAEALKGEVLFASAGCVACHVPTFTTGARHPKAELRNQTIHPYTDLLLHDMGSGLADNLPEAGAAGSEWRTAPLWNIGLTAGVSGGEAYLHDGRARSLTEAILWHGGEGANAAKKFKELSAGDAAALIKFLKSL